MAIVYPEQETHTVSMSPRLSLALTQLTRTSDPELALSKVLSEYLDLKIAALLAQIRRFEEKWNLNFEHFSQARADGTLPADPYSYPVESDFWEWEEAVTLLNHYKELRQKWI